MRSRPLPALIVRILGGTAGLWALWKYVGLFRDTLIDDAFISLKYSSVLAAYGTWGFLADRVSNTATSPLNVIVTALAGRLSGSMTDGALYVATIELGLLLLVLLRISWRLFGHRYFGSLAFIAIATNCLVLSTLGLEGVLFTLLFAWSIDLFLAQRWTWLGSAVGLLILARPDGALLGLVYLLMLPGGLASRRSFMLACAVVVAPWLLFSWVHLGSFVPDTLQIKVAQRGWGRGVSMITGVSLYLDRYPLEFVSSFLLLPFAAFGLRSSRSAIRSCTWICCGYGLAHLLAYTIAGIPPYHWYYVNEVVPVALAGALGLAALIDVQWRSGTWTSRALLGVLAALPGAGLVAFGLHMGLPLKEAPIHTNWATHEQYREIGLWMKDQVSMSEVVFNVSEMGTVSYYSQRTIVNEFSDPNMTFQAILDRYSDLPWPARLAVDVNYYWRRLQTPLPPRSYTLIHLPMPNDDEDEFGPRIVRSWDTSTRWVPRGRLYLLRATSSRERP